MASGRLDGPLPHRSRLDQSEFFLGKQAKSNRESVIIYVGDDITA